MYKVFIENREVNFTDCLNDSRNTGVFYFYPNLSVLKDIVPFVSSFPENEIITVLLMESNYKLENLFKEFIFIEAAGGIVEQDQNYLFIKRNGFWDIPKGKLDSGESSEDAAQREIEEECGLTDLMLNSLISITYHTYFHKNDWYLKKTSWFHFTALGSRDTSCQIEEGITETIWLNSSQFNTIYKNTFNSISFVLKKFESFLREEDILLNAGKLLEHGKVVAIPTETVYGLAANALLISAVEQVFSLKNRPQSNPLIVHCGSINQVKKYVSHYPEWAQKLGEKFWPGPLTLLLPKNGLIPDKITAGEERVGVRIPNHPLTLRLLKRLDFPLAAPSANKYGSISPTCAEHVRIQFGDDLPMILDGGSCKVGIESTIVGVENDKIIVYRLGQISPEEIEVVCNQSVFIKNEAGEVILAPGMVSHHYAPKTSLKIIEKNSLIVRSEKIGVILFNEKKLDEIPFENQVVLADDYNLDIASQKLYWSFYQLDKLNLDMIYIKLFPEEGIGRSLNDRIRRASFKD